MSAALAGDEVRVFVFELDVAAARQAELETHLAPEERARFARLLRECDRLRYSAARGMLRTLLAPWLDQSPSAIGFEYGSNGKPRAVGPDGPPLEFNLSHSGAWCAVAIARLPVGIDIEVLRDDVKAEAVAGSFFTDEEQVALRAVSPSERHRQFFRAWTRKEAFLKGLGSGLTIRATSVSIREHPAGLEVLAPTLGEEPACWNVQDIDLTAPLVAAIAVRGVIRRMQVELATYWSSDYQVNRSSLPVRMR